MPLASLRTSTIGRAACVLAGAASIATFAGCGSGSDSSSAGSSPSAGSDSSTASLNTGTAIFQAEGCASCHTLAAENAKGQIGPNLDQAKPSADEVTEKVTNGAGSMPSFKNRLTAAQIKTLADYVSQVAGQS